jgi:tetratricopeptide (TPR) repeat protein
MSKIRIMRQPVQMSIATLLVGALIAASSLNAPAQTPLIDNEKKALARKHFEEGKAAFELGRFKDALTAYEAAYRILPLPGMLFNIGQCYRNIGRLDQAVFSFKLYLKKIPDAQNRDAVTKLIDELEAKLEQERKAAAEEAAERARRKAELDAALRAKGSTDTPETPVHKKWWLWTAVGLALAAGTATAVYFGTRSKVELPASRFPVWDISK